MRTLTLAALVTAHAAAHASQAQAPSGATVISPAMPFDIAQPAPKRELNMIDRWRFESCQRDAAKAPTPQGVNIGMRLCREKFGQ